MTPVPLVRIYTIRTCPDCSALRAWLTKLGIAFTERDLSDPEAIAEMKSQTNLWVPPITVIGDRAFNGTCCAQKNEIIRALSPTVIG